MTEYICHPPAVHAGDECPVPPETLTRVLCEGKNWTGYGPAWVFDWTRRAVDVIVCYQITTPVPEPVVSERVFITSGGYILSARSAHADDKQRIALPTRDDKLVSCKCGMCRVEDL